MVPDELIFRKLPADKLPAIARYLGFDVVVDGKLLSKLPEARRIQWLDAHRQDLEDTFRWVGSSVFGKRKTYREIVIDTAEKIGAHYHRPSDTPAVERAIVQKLWNDAVARMTPEQRAEFHAAMEKLAAQYGKDLGKEVSGLAALGVAQLSGFGVYMAGSTLLGALNSALGLGLGFGAFTGLSSLISVIIGPLGWVTLGLITLVKLGAPNYKKVLPVILLIATWRGQCATLGPTASPAVSSGATQFAAGKPEENSAKPLPRPRPIQRQSEMPDKPAEDSTRSGAQPTGNLGAAIAQVTRQTRQKLASTRADPVRKPTRMEKVEFNLKNPGLSKLAQELTGEHFLELSTEEQEILVELYREREELQRQEEERQQKLKQQARMLEQKTARNGSKRRRSIESKRREFKPLLPNLEFQDRALERLLSLEEDQRVVVLQQLKQLDAGNIVAKHEVPRTFPRLYQRDAGGSLRIYYRLNGAPNRVLVHLIGTKSTQDADYEAMRRGA